MAILIFAVLIVAAAVIFSYQNSAVATVSFVKWNFTASLAIVVFLSVLAGMVITGFLWLVTTVKKGIKKKAKTEQVTAATNRDGASIVSTTKNL